jgi:predicted NUDIX family phosphoesterase
MVMPPDGVHPLPANFLSKPLDEFYLCDRAVCETDESVVQLIPYIVLTKPDDTIYCYSRGGAGGEARLYSKLSIGLGGHVDRAPTVDLLSLLRNEAARELMEEVGLLANLNDINFCEMIVDRSDAVGRVHLGLLTVLNVPQDVELRCEDKVIENGEFLSLETLALPTNYDHLENWSKHVVKYLHETKPSRKNTELLKLAAEYFRGGFVAIDDTASLVLLLERLAGGQDRLNDGSKYDNPCFVNAGEREPIFTIRAQDNIGGWAVSQWAYRYRDENATYDSIRGWSWADPKKEAKFNDAIRVAEEMAKYATKKTAD